MAQQVTEVPSATPRTLLVAPGRRVVRSFLPEVQALRAVAVALVVVYHARPSALSGGFVGVDVFFVISGYLITGHMLREVRATGSVGLARFWANRARRILPAALVTIVVVSLVAVRVLPPDEWAELFRQGLASVLYVQNWVLGADSVDYLASDNPATVFQHFWTLAVEEQFYLVWPVLVLAVSWTVRRAGAAHGGGRGRRGGAAPRLGPALLVVLGAVVLVSFVWSVIRVGAGDASAYFATTTRLWELGVGGLLAVALRHTDRFALARCVLALGGLAAIAFAAVTYDGDTPFPGASAAVPVLGTAAVIAAGRTRGIGSLTPVVDLPPVQWLGNVSYSLYLWHFPVIVLFGEVVGRQPTLMESVGLVAVGLGCAALSYTLVEQPVRSLSWLRGPPRRALLLAGAGMGLAALVVAVFPVRQGMVDQQWRQLAAQVVVEPASGLGAQAATGEGAPPAFVGSAHRIAPDPVSAGGADTSSVLSEPACSTPALGRTIVTCELGDLSSSTVVALVGDSHARMLATPVAALAKARGWKVVTFLHSSCPFSTEKRVLEEQGKLHCVAQNGAVLARLVALHPVAVITSAYGGSTFVDGHTGHPRGVEGFADEWNALEDAGVPVFAVKDAPAPRVRVQSCVAEHYDDPGRCGVPRATGLKGRDVIPQAAALAPRTTLIDLTDAYCGPKTCPPVIGDVLVYRDTNHLTDTYAQSLLPRLDAAIPVHPTSQRTSHPTSPPRAP